MNEGHVDRTTLLNMRKRYLHNEKTKTNKITIEKEDE